MARGHLFRLLLWAALQKAAALVHSSGNGTSTTNSTNATNVTNATNGTKSLERVTLEVFYEADCRYCRGLFSGPLKDIWEDKEMRARLDLKYFPFGNGMMVRESMVSEGYRYWHTELNLPGKDYIFKCMHGPDECFSNTLHTCVQDIVPQVDAVAMVVCMMEKIDTVTERSSLECAEKYNQSHQMQKIKECVNGGQGNQLMHEAAVRTKGLHPRHTYMPWILIDGQHFGETADGGNIISPICNLLKAPKPKMCDQKEEVLAEEDSALIFAQKRQVRGLARQFCFPGKVEGEEREM